MLHEGVEDSLAVFTPTVESRLTEEQVEEDLLLRLGECPRGLFEILVAVSSVGLEVGALCPFVLGVDENEPAVRGLISAGKADRVAEPLAVGFWRGVDP